MTRFQGKVALISAAGAGIGRATAMIIAREGGTVVGVDLEPAVLERLAADVVAAGGRALAVRADALDAASVEGAVRQAVEAYGRIDILVNGVGGSTVVSRPAALLDELTLEEWQKLIHFNLTGTFLFSHAVIPVMKRQGSGKIVNLASIAGRGLSRRELERLRHRQGRHHRAHPQAGLRAGPPRRHGQRDRAQPHALRAHPAALGAPHARKGRPPRSSAPRSGGWPRRRTRRGSSASWPRPTPTSSPASPST